MNEKLVVIYRIKNEERWIEKSINSVYDLCSEIVVLDGGSTDNTVEICKGFDKVVDIRIQENEQLDETLERNILLKMAYARNPDIVFALDGDELLMKNAKNILFEELFTLYPEKSVFEFQMLTLWDKPNQIRIDGKFLDYWKKLLFRLKGQPDDLLINDSPYSNNLHCGSIPNNTKGIENSVKSNVKLFHYASIDQKIRQKKYDWYRKIDPDNTMTDNYQHMLGAKGRFSGSKLKFMSIPSNLAYDFN